MSHSLIGLAVRVSPLPSPQGEDRSFDGVIADVHSAGCFVVLRTDDGSVGFWGAEYVRFTDPERAARVLRAHATAQDVTTDGRTLSQVCTELVEAKQTAARMSDALRDLAVELDLPMGLPARAILDAIRAKVVTPKYTPPRWVRGANVQVGARILACTQPDGSIVPAPSGYLWESADREAAQEEEAARLLILVGEWPPLPKVTT